jgi:hypothetical protein
VWLPPARAQTLIDSARDHGYLDVDGLLGVQRQHASCGKLIEWLKGAKLLALGPKSQVRQHRVDEPEGCQNPVPSRRGPVKHPAYRPVEERPDHASPPQVAATKHGKLPAHWSRLARCKPSPESTFRTLRGTTEAGVATYCIWQAPLLVVAKRAKGRLSGRLYRIPNSHPATLSAGWQPSVGVSENLPKPSDEWYAGGTPPADAAELLRDSGVLHVPLA